jgi:hypothetical protein
MDKCQRLFFQDRSDLRLLVLRVISHNAVIVRQTNEQVKRAHSLQPTEHQAQKLRIGKASPRALPDDDRFQ